ncbi:MAG: MFS transporter [Thermoplasmata archaeon]
MGYAFKAYSIIVARALYALNWFDIAPGLIYISTELKLKVVDLGIVATSFYLGLAAFQLLGGALASRVGAKKVAFVGLMILGIGGVLSGMSSNLFELSASRFLAGSGSALFFSPGLTVLREISTPDSYGFQVGLYNGAFNLGGGIGAFGWVFVDRAIGWRMGLVLGGALILVAALENLIALRGEVEEKAIGHELIGTVVGVLRNRLLWILPVATVISMFAETVGGQFLVYYAEQYLLIPASEAGLVDGLFLLLGFVGGIVGGRMLSRRTGRGWFAYFVLILTGLSLLSISFARSFLVLAVLSSITGFSLVSGFTVLYIESVRFLKEKPMIPFALAFVNGVSIALGSASPYLFTFVAYRLNHYAGWMVLGIIGIAMIPLLHLAEKHKGN